MDHSLLREISEGTFQRLMFIPQKKYFVAKDARIVSLNTAEPRIIEHRTDTSGEKLVTLYTPQLRSYSVAEIVLKVFQGEPNDKNQAPTYLDNDSSNCNLYNLSWGGAISRLERETTQIIETARTLSQESAIEEGNLSHILSEPLRNELNRFLIHLSRITILEKIDKHDQIKIKKLVEVLSTKVTTNVFTPSLFFCALPEDLVNVPILDHIKEFKVNVQKYLKNYTNQ